VSTAASALRLDSRARTVDARHGVDRCGAIKGAIDNAELGNLTGLLAKIKPAVQATVHDGVQQRRVNQTVGGNFPATT
jgi:hypothetical protein